MLYASTTDKKFLSTLDSWLRDKPEILVLFRPSGAAGSKSFEFFSSFATFLDRFRHWSPSTSVTAFRQRQLPHRGVVDDRFIAACLIAVPDGAEFLVVETAERSSGGAFWFHDVAGESHRELQEALEDSRGRHVAVGAYPAFWDEDPDVISAIVPNEEGTISPGIY